MFDTTILRSILKEIYGVDDKYLVPLNNGWFVPTVDPNEKVGTWIGYRINSYTPYTRAYQAGLYYTKPIKVKFRISFVGPEAETLVQQTLLWEDRKDVTDALEKYQLQINYDSREIYSYPIRNAGFNDMLCWIVDFSAQTSYEVDTKQKPWIPRG